MTLEKPEKLEKKKHNPNYGGKRKGSGRKPDLVGAELKEAERAIKSHGMQVALTEGYEGLTRIEIMYEKLFEKGLTGDTIAADKYLDRQMGKATNKTELTGKDGKDLKVITGFNFVKNKKE